MSDAARPLGTSDDSLSITLLSPAGVRLTGPLDDDSRRVLTPAALDFLGALERRFGERRQALLERRRRRQAQLDAGVPLDFLEETEDVRAGTWSVVHKPQGLRARPLGSGHDAGKRPARGNAPPRRPRARLADFEDAVAPTWRNITAGQVQLLNAVHDFGTASSTLYVRPRGWHMLERHAQVDGQVLSATLFDAGLYLFHGGRALSSAGSPPYLVLPKLEGHLEARLWNDVLEFVEDRLGLQRGAVRVTVLIETLPAAFQMEEILFELRERVTGLSWGHDDHVFSFQKSHRAHAEALLPDRASLGMDRPFLRAHADLLVRTCRRRRAQAVGVGGVSTSASRGVRVRAGDLLEIPRGPITEAGLRDDLRIGLRYLSAWISGEGRIRIDGLAVDAARAEIARTQVWHWRRHGARLDDGRRVDEVRIARVLDQELERLHGQLGDDRYHQRRVPRAAELLRRLVFADQCAGFLTTRAYGALEESAA